MEPAVLARNILIFAMIDEEEPTSTLWDIFFHFHINKTAMSRLTTVAAQLSNASTTLENWKQSKWGSYLRTVDQQTMVALHRRWKLYSEFSSLPTSRSDKLRAENSQMVKRFEAMQGNNAGVGRSAGIFWATAMTPMAKLFKRYRDNGTTFTSPDDIKAATELNPTFVYSMSGERFNPHYGTFPQGFFFAPVFASVSGPDSSVGPTADEIMAVAKEQFTAWCQSFRTARAVDAITIRFFSGEATALCHALGQYSKTGQARTGIFTSQWRGSEVDFTDCLPIPTTFDVIDTSNLLDHLGALNVLVITQPLLKRQPASQSVLYTEALLPSGNNASQSLLDRLCADIPTIAMLIGLAPRACLSSFTTQSNAHEIIVSSAFKDISQYHERVAWVDPASGDPTFSENITVSFDPTDLADLLLGIYIKMFKDEQITPELMKNPTAAAAREMSQPHYHRESFALLLRLVRNRIEMPQADWDQMVNRFLQLVTSNQASILEMNHYQDLCLQLHLYGLFTVTSLRPNWQNVPRAATIANFKIFDGWDDVPPAVCVVVTVPRKSLGLLLNDEAGSPRFQMNLMGGAEYHNNYSSLHGIWGKCIKNPNDRSSVLVEEDPEGVHGTSDLIVSFWASSYLVVTEDTTVCLALRQNPFTLSQFMPKLGVNMVVFQASLEDNKYVTVVRDRPMAGSAVQRVSRLALGSSPAQSSNGDVTYRVGVSRNEKTKSALSPSFITGKLSITLPDERAKLSEGASVSARQLSPCAMEVTFGDCYHQVSYPYPITEVGHRLRIARKSHYIEIISNIADPIGSGGYSLNAFAILGRDSYTPWNIHHINLGRSPLLTLKSKDNLGWLKTHCVLQVSDRERALSETTKNKPENWMVQVKESIYTMFTHYTGIEGGPTRVFCFCDPNGNLGVYTMVMVAGVRLDLASSTMVLDAAVVPLSVSKMPLLLPGIQALHSSGGKQVEQLFTDETEIVAWKRLVPALVERCRTWSHKPSCEYISANKIPLSVEASYSPICSCGEGIGFTSPEWNVSWWTGLLPHATRIAISPMFAVSYLDQVGGELARMMGSRSAAPVGIEKSSTSCWACAGPGRPNLSVCSRCKKARYCSPECQRKDWKGHKNQCISV
ncbi:kinase domain protein [Ceratobasidium sp. AG-Ba]|nr:kinase domain protein [Ceratobasidium sp. AG-Ba]